MNSDRQPRGVHEGGQFKSRVNPESTLELKADSMWPPITYETRQLDDQEISEAQMQRSRRASIERNYAAAVTPSIAEITSIDVPTELMAEVEEASAEIARFDQEIASEFANFTAILLRSESSSSSEIEKLTAQAKSIVLAEAGSNETGRNARLIANNARAMQRAIELAESMDEASIIAVQETIIGEEHPEWVGHWRSEQVRIGGFSVHDARFVPPHPDRVPAAMTDLLTFARREDLPVFTQTAIAHAQFETIHPFPDGNGRTGRALIHAMFAHHGLTRHVTVPVSAGLLMDPEAYFDTLSQYRRGDVSPIIRMMVNATFRATHNGRQLARDLEEVEGRWRERFKARSDSAAWKIVSLAMRQPALTSSVVQREIGVSQQNADRAIGQLVDAGILSPASESRRNRFWVATDVTAALDSFATRARRGKII